MEQAREQGSRQAKAPSKPRTAEKEDGQNKRDLEERHVALRSREVKPSSTLKQAPLSRCSARPCPPQRARRSITTRSRRRRCGPRTAPRPTHSNATAPPASARGEPNAHRVCCLRARLPVWQFIRDSWRLVKRCTKPDRTGPQHPLSEPRCAPLVTRRGQRR